MYVCTICNSFVGQTFSATLRHMGSHRFDPGLLIRCGINSCTEQYKNFESFRSHVYRKHREVLVSVDGGDSTSAPMENLGTSGVEYQMNNEADGTDSDGDDELQASIQFKDDPKRLAALFLLKTREERKVTQTALNGIVRDVQGIWKDAMERLQESVRDRLSEDSMESVMECFDESSPFDGLESQHFQHKYYKDHFFLLEPEQRILGRHYEEENGKLVEVIDCCYDIPLLKSLQCLLRTEVVVEQVMNSHSLPSGRLGDYCDGYLYRNSELFKEDPCGLQIQLYFDELEVCNPIGSKAKKHKLGLVYYLLGNLDPKLRSSLKSIQLLCVAKNTAIVRYGVEELLKPIVASVQELEKEGGVMFLFDGMQMAFRGTLTIMSADNLAAWAIGGFKALASAFRKCQYCMVVDKDMQTKFTERDVRLRTKQLYETHCEDLGGPLHDHDAITYGIVCDSALNACRYFHITSGLAPDIMHVILEGSLELCMRHLLIHFIHEDKLFTLTYLNARIASISYGHSEVKNKPSQIAPINIAPDGHLKQSATQMWCLGRFLPLLIGHLVPEGDQFWENYLMLLTIIDFVFAPITSDDKADYVAMLVEDFLTDFKKLYPERRLIPKMHYMIHLATWMKWCGPLSRVWCMRYEAKHSYFKHLARVLGNFKNIAKTLAEHHQLYMCYQMSEPANYLRSVPEFTGERSVVLQDLHDYETEIMRIEPELESNTVLQRITSTLIDGTKYRKGMVMVCGIDNDTPLFGKISDLIVTPKNECLFVMSQLMTIEYRHHYHSYLVLPTESVVVFKHSQFFDFHPLVCTKPAIRTGHSNSLFVSVKYHLF